MILSGNPELERRRNALEARHPDLRWAEPTRSPTGEFEAWKMADDPGDDKLIAKHVHLPRLLDQLEAMESL